MASKNSNKQTEKFLQDGYITTRANLYRVSASCLSRDVGFCLKLVCWRTSWSHILSRMVLNVILEILILSTNSSSLFWRYISSHCTFLISMSLSSVMDLVRWVFLHNRHKRLPRNYHKRGSFPFFFCLLK